MNKIMIWGAGLALAGAMVGCGQPAAVRAANSRVGAARGSWGKAIEVPGLGTLSTGKHGYARVNSVSCASAGNCAAAGQYEGSRAAQQGFVAVERNGRWGKAIEVPGLAALNKGRFAAVQSVSCPSAGYCAAAGYYGDADEHDTDGFVVVEKNGAWGKAVTFPTSEFGEVDSIFCTSPGNCLAGGSGEAEYFTSAHGFIAQERNGHWGKAIGVPGLPALNKGGAADVDAAWCGSSGNCVVGGYYSAAGGNSQAFLAVERNGAWGQATQGPGLATLNERGNAQVNSVSCASQGNCLAGGYYQGSDSIQGFVAVDRNGTWGQATQVPGLAALNKTGRPTTVQSVSCAPAGRCAPGGFYTDHSGHRQGFVTTEDNGAWGTPIPLPGLAVLNKGESAEVGALSCPAPGACIAGGGYTDSSRHRQGFVS